FRVRKEVRSWHIIFRSKDEAPPNSGALLLPSGHNPWRSEISSNSRNRFLLSQDISELFVPDCPFLQQLVQIFRWLPQNLRFPINQKPGVQWKKSPLLLFYDNVRYKHPECE